MDRRQERTHIERNLARILESKVATGTRAEYLAQFQAMFPQSPKYASFETFKKLVARFGFTNENDVAATFARYQDPNDGRIQFHEFGIGLMPFNHTSDLRSVLGGRFARPRPKQKHGLHTERQGESIQMTAFREGEPPSRPSTVWSTRSQNLDSPISLLAPPTKQQKEAKKLARLARGFGRKSTYVTNASYLDKHITSMLDKPPPEDKRFQSSVADQLPQPNRYETSYMLSNSHHKTRPSTVPTGRGRPPHSEKSALVAQLCTGALAVKEGPQAAPRQSTWITGYEHLPPPKLKNAGEERKMANTVSGNIQPTSQVAEPYVTKYMLDTDAADRPTARQAKLVQPIHSQSGIAIIAMGAAPNSGLIEHTHQCSLVDPAIEQRRAQEEARLAAKENKRRAAAAKRLASKMRG